MIDFTSVGLASAHPNNKGRSDTRNKCVRLRKRRALLSRDLLWGQTKMHPPDKFLASDFLVLSKHSLDYNMGATLEFESLGQGISF